VFDSLKAMVISIFNHNLMVFFDTLLLSLFSLCIVNIAI